LPANTIARKLLATPSLANRLPKPSVIGGIGYETSKLNKSRLYLESLAHFNRGAVSLPDHEKLSRELRCLERRVHRSGRDSVDHPQYGSDDYANAVCGALYICVHDLRRPRLRVGAIDVNGFVHWKDGEAPRRCVRVAWRRNLSAPDTLAEGRSALAKTSRGSR
jgi:hypothetical protein